jgi:hypothetical protein
MKYYKDAKDKPWAYEEDADPKYIKEGLTEITKDEFDELVKEINTPTPEQKTEMNKAKAVGLLMETDFVEVPSVSDPESDPYLTNKADFVPYRNALRKIAVNPTPESVFPDKPEEVWGLGLSVADAEVLLDA